MVRKRPRIEPTDDWRELLPLFWWPEQEEYERIRQPGLFGSPVAERAEETGVSERRTLQRPRPRRSSPTPARSSSPTGRRPSTGLSASANWRSRRASAAFLARIRSAEPAPVSGEERDEGSASEERDQIFREIREGLRALAGNPTVRSLVSCTGTIAFFNAVIEAVLVLYLVRVLGLSAATIGIIFSVGGFGFLVGAVLAGRVTTYVPVGVVLVGGPLLIGVADLLIPLAGGPALLAVGLPCAAQFLFGVGLPLYRVNEVSLRQMIVPERFLGRVNSGEYFVREGLIPFGALFGGLLGEVIWLRPTLVVGALGEMAALAWVLFSPARSLRRHPDSSPE